MGNRKKTHYTDRFGNDYDILLKENHWWLLQPTNRDLLPNSRVILLHRACNHYTFASKEWPNCRVCKSPIPINCLNTFLLFKNAER